MDSTFSSPCGDVTQEARDRLRRSPYMPVRSLSCEFDRGVLRLRGRLSSFYQKQLAQEAVIGMSGVEEVINDVAVVPKNGRFTPR
jgi:osmotically-inducible protein OsmY